MKDVLNSAFVNAYSATESKGKLVKCGKYLSVVITAAVEGLRALSWRVSLKNSSLTSALKALAGVLHTPALSNMHTSIISAFKPGPLQNVSRVPFY